MLQLIIALLSVALLTLAWLPHAQIAPATQQRQEDSALMLKRALPQFQKAYQALGDLNDGFPPEPHSSGDAAVVFGEMLRLMPVAPANFGWVYAKDTRPDSAFLGRDYICAYAQSPQEGQFEALGTVDAVMADYDVVVGSGCNSSLAGELRSPTSPAALTFYLTYEPPPEEPPPEEGPETPPPEQPPA